MRKKFIAAGLLLGVIGVVLTLEGAPQINSKEGGGTTGYAGQEYVGLAGGLLTIVAVVLTVYGIIAKE